MSAAQTGGRRDETGAGPSAPRSVWGAAATQKLHTHGMIELATSHIKRFSGRPIRM